MFHFYFGEAIPNITDWIQALGAIAVFYTLYLQYQSNQNQQKQLRISLIPKFEIQLKNEEDIFNENLTSLILTFTLMRNIAYNIRFITTDTGNVRIHNYVKSRSLTDGGFFEISASLVSEDAPESFSFTLHFEDILGNCYSQNVAVFAGDLAINAPLLKQ